MCEGKQEAGEGWGQQVWRLRTLCGLPLCPASLQEPAGGCAARWEGGAPCQGGFRAQGEALEPALPPPVPSTEEGDFVRRGQRKKTSETCLLLRCRGARAPGPPPGPACLPCTLWPFVGVLLTMSVACKRVSGSLHSIPLSLATPAQGPGEKSRTVMGWGGEEFGVQPVPGEPGGARAVMRLCWRRSPALKALSRLRA